MSFCSGVWEIECWMLIPCDLPKNNELLQVILSSIVLLQNLDTFFYHIFLQIYTFIKFIKCFTFMFHEHCVLKSGFVISKCNKVTIATNWIFSHITNITVHLFKQTRCMRFNFWRLSCVTFSWCILHKGIYQKYLYILSSDNMLSKHFIPMCPNHLCYICLES